MSPVVSGQRTGQYEAGSRFAERKGNEAIAGGLARLLPNFPEPIAESPHQANHT
jgi:hypothetical protein